MQTPAFNLSHTDILHLLSHSNSSSLRFTLATRWLPKPDISIIAFYGVSITRRRLNHTSIPKGFTWTLEFRKPLPARIKILDLSLMPLPTHTQTAIHPTNETHAFPTGFFVRVWNFFSFGTSVVKLGGDLDITMSSLRNNGWQLPSF